MEGDNRVAVVDPETDAILRENFPDFFYGKTLGFTRLYDIKETVSNQRPPPLKSATARGKGAVEGQEAAEDEEQGEQEDGRGDKRKEAEDEFEEVSNEEEVFGDFIAGRKRHRRKRRRAEADQGAVKTHLTEAQAAQVRQERLRNKLAHQEDDADSRFNLVAAFSWEDSVVWDDSEAQRTCRACEKKVNTASQGSFMVCKACNFSFHAACVNPGISPRNFMCVDCETRKKLKDMTELEVQPTSNTNLSLIDYDNDVIWDDEMMESMPEGKIVLDRNDLHMLLDDLVSRPYKDRRILFEQFKGRRRIPNWKMDQMQEEVNKNGRLSLNGKDPFNLSNDKYYRPKDEKNKTTLDFRASLGKRVVVHSIPALKLSKPFFPTVMTKEECRNFHRPLMEIPTGRDARAPLASLTKHITATQQLRESIREKDAKASMLKTREDITARDGDIILAEYIEEHPLLIMRPGMSTLINNYFVRRAEAGLVPPRHALGITVVLGPKESSPFLGSIRPGESLQSFENELFRAPIYSHATPPGDFLLVHRKGRFEVRTVQGLFTVGQIMPKVVVPAPNSKKQALYERMRLTVFILRLFKQNLKKTGEQCVLVKDIRKAFPKHSEANIRKRLREVAEFRRGGPGDETGGGAWYWNERLPFPSEKKLQQMLNPESVCAYESMEASMQRLKDMGYKLLSIEKSVQEYDKDPNVLQVDDEVKMAPWRSTADFLDCMNNKCLLAVTGPAEPTGCGQGFSYLRLANKPVNTQPDKLLPQIAVIPRPVTGSLAGTDADLRKLRIDEMRKLLHDKFGMDYTVLNSLDRWKLVHFVRKKFNEEAETTDEAGKFVRGQRSVVAEHQERFKETCQEIFEKQNKSLRSDEVLSSPESSSSDEELDGLSKDLQGAMSSGKEREADEMRHRAEFAELLRQNASQRSKAAAAEAAESEASGDGNTMTLVITRTYIGKNGKPYERTEYVHDSRVISSYMSQRDTTKVPSTRPRPFQTKAAAANADKPPRAAPAAASAATASLSAVGNAGSPHPPGSPSAAAAGANASRPSASNLLRCSACGEVGHIKTNKKCPKFSETQGGKADKGAMEVDNDMDEVSSEISSFSSTKIRIRMPSTPNLSVPASPAPAAGPLKIRLPLGQQVSQSPAEDEEFDTYKPIRTGRNTSRNPDVALNAAFEEILATIRTFDDARLYLEPVDKKVVTDYYRIVKKPMDFGTMRNKARDQQYRSREEFIADFRQMLFNSVLYNGSQSPYYHMIYRLRNNIFELLQQKSETLDIAEKELGTYTKPFDYHKDEEDRIIDRWVAQNAPAAQVMSPGENQMVSVTSMKSE